MASNTMTNEERLAAAEARKEQALAQLNSTYDPIINQVDGHFQAQIDASKEWAETQSKNQQEQTDFAIEKIEQQKDQTEKDYTKEQSGAYVDWQKQSGEYGVNAEQMATMGMEGTGYAESSQVSMYNTYQNRVATARESYTRAVLNYDNAIKDAVLQNNAVLAEIAATALEQQLEIALEAFQYKNSLMMAKASAVASVNSDYMSVYDQIQKEPKADPVPNAMNVYANVKYLQNHGASKSEVREYIMDEAPGLTGTERRELAAKYSGSGTRNPR